uniref:Uncharacterized protein n=1 Tax=Oryza meridionalis TaxID=40149 RepID=A0A0E0CMQ0_9ORYZ
MRPAAQETVAAVPVPAPETTAARIPLRNITNIFPIGFCMQRVLSHDYTGAPCQASTEKGARCGGN